VKNIAEMIGTYGEMIRPETLEKSYAYKYSIKCRDELIPNLGHVEQVNGDLRS
jgi:hypothetical protein